MNKENKKLGMGLGALLSNTKQNIEGVKKINISNIKPNKNQPRKKFNSTELGPPPTPRPRSYQDRRDYSVDMRLWSAARKI